MPNAEKRNSGMGFLLTFFSVSFLCLLLSLTAGNSKLIRSLPQKNVRRSKSSNSSSSSKKTPEYVRPLKSEIEVAMKNRLNVFRKIANKLVLIHCHIPKAGGTALALALSTPCVCRNTSKTINDMCSCPAVEGPRGHKSQVTWSRVSGWPCDFGKSKVSSCHRGLP